MRYSWHIIDRALHAGNASCQTRSAKNSGHVSRHRRSLACTNSIENIVCGNVKRGRNAAIALRWTAAGMLEAAKGFRRLKAYEHMPALRAALAAHQSKYLCFAYFNKIWSIVGQSL